MTNEEAIEYNNNLREYMRITDKNSENKFLKENYEALDMGNKALEQQGCVWEIAYERGKVEVLDKIRAEILDEAEYAYADFDQYKEDILYAEPDELPNDDFRYGMERAVEIINKYRRGER